MAAQFAVGGAVVPFVTLLLQDRGLGFGQISLIFTASSATLLFFPFLWGMLADRFLPLNRLFTILNLVACGALLMLATAHTHAGMLLAYTGYFACFNPSLYLMNALCFHHLPNAREQFGKVRAWGSLGWIVPFLPISVWLAARPTPSLDFVVYLGAICAVGMVVVSFWLPHTPPGAKPVRPSPASSLAAAGAVRMEPVATGGGAESPSWVGAPRPTYGFAVRQLVRDPNYLLLLLSMFLMAGSFSLLTYYSPALLQAVGIPRPWLGPIQAVGVVFEIVLFQVQPVLLRRWRYTVLVLAGCVALALRHLLFALAENAWILTASYLLAGVVIVFYNQGISLLVNTMAAKEVRATAQTLLLLFGQGVGPLFANAVTGHLAVQGGRTLRPVFLFAAGLAALAAAVVAARGPRLEAATSTSGVRER